MTTAAELAPGSVLAGFRIESQIGRGGMGVVYRATQLSLERSVALKLISPELASEERFRERFLREARLAASIDHPHLLPVYEAGEAESTLFLAMRLVEGSSLAELLRHEGALAAERAVPLFIQLCSALEAAHASGLLHRDVKPANVLVAGESEGAHAYLCDFGLARRLSGGSLTRERAFLGTATYAAPEQIRGEPLDGRADLYALACLLYECLTGEPPFVREDELALLWAHLHELAPAPSRVDPALAGFDPFFARALAKDPGERYPSAPALAQAAQAALAGALPAPPPPGLPQLKLPRPLTSFLGRERELQELLTLFLEEDTRLLTLTGPGGTGKTRLALRAAEEAAPAFPDGVFWIALAALRDPALVTETIAQVLEAKGELHEHIAERRLLLLLDNFEQVVEAAPELASLLQACPNLTLLVTSRELLRVSGEAEYSVPPLSEPEAVALFCTRARLEPSEEIAELCARLDNLPLAVELAAARTKALSPEQILERLSQRLDLFKGGRDADPRQQTLRATIEWSYDLLSPWEQQLFARLSVFSGGCTLEAAEEVAGADLDTLQSLVEKSLLRFTQERYWMLETIREYASERLGGSGEAEKPRQRHADWVLRLAEEAEEKLMGSNAAAWLTRLESELGNLRAAVDWALVRDPALVSRVAAALWWFWARHGHTAEPLRWLEAARSEDLSLEVRLRALRAEAAIANAIFDVPRLVASSERRLELARRAGDIRHEAAALYGLACAAQYERDFARAKRLFSQALNLREIGDEPLALATLGALGVLAHEEGDLAQARKLLEESLVISRTTGRESEVAWALIHLGGVAAEQRAYEDARQCLLEGSDIARRHGDLQLLFVLLLTISFLATDKGQAENAAVLAGALDSLSEAIGMATLPLHARWLAMLDRVPDALGDREFRALFANGRSLELDDAIEYALSCLD